MVFPPRMRGARASNNISAGRPGVVHIVVALSDNENQGLVSVPSHLGNGQNPRENLYGERYMECAPLSPAAPDSVFTYAGLFSLARELELVEKEYAKQARELSWS